MSKSSTKQRLLTRIGKLTRRILRTERAQVARRAMLRRLRTGEDLALLEFITNTRYAPDGSIIRDYNTQGGKRRRT